MFRDVNVVGEALGGANCADITKLMRKNAQFMSGQLDVTTVLCFLNGAVDGNHKYSGEPAGLRSSFIEMCLLLKEKSVRPFLILGGSAKLWGFDSS